MTSTSSEPVTIDELLELRSVVTRFAIRVQADLDRVEANIDEDTVLLAEAISSEGLVPSLKSVPLGQLIARLQLMATATTARGRQREVNRIIERIDDTLTQQVSSGRRD